MSFTKTAEEVFDPLDGATPRGADMEEVKTWATEVEAQLPVYGDWTPALAFATPGTSSIILSTAVGKYVKLGRLYICSYDIVTSTFSHGSASGTLRVTGLPATVETGYRTPVAEYQGFTKANFTQLSAVPLTTLFTFTASGSGQTLDTTLGTTDFPDVGPVILRGVVMFQVAA